MKTLKKVIQRCQERHKNPLRQRKTVVAPVLYNKGYPYHFTAYCAQRYPILLSDLEKENISFMPIGQAPENDNGPRALGGERFLKRQGIEDWGVRRWHASWGIQIYTGTPSGLNGASWHDFHFTYQALCDFPEAFLACIEALVESIPNPLLVMTKSGGLRFSIRIPDYVHPRTKDDKYYIYKSSTEKSDRNDIYLEIFGEEGYNRWDARYEILLGNLLEPPVVAKEVVFTPIDALRVMLHDSTPIEIKEYNKKIEAPNTLGSWNLDLAKDALLKRGFSYIQQENRVHLWTPPQTEINERRVSLWEDKSVVWLSASTPDIGLPTKSTPITDIWDDTGIIPLVSNGNIFISDEVSLVREGELSPLTIKRPSPMLHKPKITKKVYGPNEKNEVHIQNVLNQTDQILGLIADRSSTKHNKIESYIRNGGTTCLNVQSLKLAEKIEGRYKSRDLPFSEGWKPRMYLWEQVKKIPFSVRMEKPFQLGNVCEDPERCDAFEEKGGDASESICPECPVYTTCQQHGFLSQSSALGNAKTQILSLPELFYDPKYADIAEIILKQTDGTERLCIIDKGQVYKLFPKCNISKNILEEWSVIWRGWALGNYAKTLLHAVDVEGIPHADVVKRIRRVTQAFEWQQDQLIDQMCKVNVSGKVIEQDFVDLDSNKQLASFAIQFENDVTVYIPLDKDAEAKLIDLKQPFFKLSGSALNEEIKILMPLEQAIQLGVLSIKTVVDIQKLPTICAHPNWTFWHQLKNFFEYYTRDDDAPIRWTGDVLEFWVPPVLHPNVKRLMIMSSHLSDQHLRKAFPDEKIKIHCAEPTTWVTGNKIFQIRSGLYPRKLLVNYNSNWDITGTSLLGQRIFTGIQTEIDRNTNIRHAIITYKSIVNRLEYLAIKENVSFVTHFTKTEGLNDAFQETQVIWIIGTPTIPQNTVWKRAQILYGNDKMPLSYEEDPEIGRYKDKRVQSVNEQAVAPLISKIIQQAKLNRLPNKKVVLISSLNIQQITDRSEILLFDWEDFEVADGLDKLPEVIETREHFEKRRDNITKESKRVEVEHILGCSSRQANRILQKLRGGKRLRVPFREQILSLLADGEKKTAEFIQAIEGHPKAVKNELSRLVGLGEIVKVRWGVYRLP